jgi:uncharacterized RDD family membrane protein YckC
MQLFRRSFAWGIDVFIISLFLKVYFWNFGTEIKDGSGYSLAGTEAFFIFAFWCVYFIAFETLIQASPGKLVFKLRVICLDGSKPDFIKIVKRRSTDIVELIFFIIIAPILVLATQREQRLGDIISGTVVIRK